MSVKFCHCMGRTYVRGVWEQGAEENIWTYKGGTGIRLETTA